MNWYSIDMDRNIKTGFTLIEVLLVIAILAILAAVVIVAINPAKQMANARDAQRSSDVYTILNAVHQYAVDHEGALPIEIVEDEYQICFTNTASCQDLINLSELTEGQIYLTAMPRDPLCQYDNDFCVENGTGYNISKSTNGRVTVSAPGTEGATEISVVQ